MPRRIVSSVGARKLPSAPKSHTLPAKFPSGTVLKDLCKKEWQLGSVLGQGGFGLIYLASDDCSKPVDSKSVTYVVKIEPKGNGPLFCEIHFYQRVAKPEFIQSFIKEHRLQYLGIPPYVATGLEKFKTQEYRFLVMPRLGTDLQKILQDCGGQFQPHATFAIGLRMLDALQFLHDKEYVHADIKAANILFGFSKGCDFQNEVYLVDYGLAYRYTVGNEHKDYKEDVKRAHNGTIEFTSRDAHRGLAPSRRGDLEILGYCMLQWLCGKLPWDNMLTDPNKVFQCKENFMKNVLNEVGVCLPNSPNITESVCKYFQLVNKLEYCGKPNYDHIREILRTALARSGHKDEWIIDFSTKGRKRKHATDTSSSSSLLEASPKKSPKRTLASPRVKQSSELKNPAASKLKTSAAGPSSKAAASSRKNSPATLEKSRKNSPATSGKKSKLVPSSSTPKLAQLSSPKGKRIVNGRRPKKEFPMPPPTVSKVTAKLKVAAGIQTSPGLLLNN